MVNGHSARLSSGSALGRFRADAMAAEGCFVWGMGLEEEGMRSGESLLILRTGFGGCPMELALDDGMRRTNAVGVRSGGGGGGSSGDVGGCAKLPEMMSQLRDERSCRGEVRHARSAGSKEASAVAGGKDDR